MSKSNSYRKETYEDKFDRKYWVHNAAKRSWIRWTKRKNNKKYRHDNKPKI